MWIFSRAAGAAFTIVVVSLLSVLVGLPAAPAVADDVPRVTAGPTASSVVQGRSLRVVGAVVGAPRAPVEVRLRTGTTWSVLARGRAGDDGRYAVALPTDWYWSGRLQVLVPAGPGRPAAATSPLFSAAVRPGYAPRGRARSWTDMSGVRARWDGCRPVTWRVNTAGMPSRGVPEVRRALGMLRAATGFRFQYVGTTSALPWNRLGRVLWGPADLTVAWSAARSVPGLRGGTVGVGGGRWQREGSGPAIYVQGGAVLERRMPAHVRRGFVAGPSTGTLLLHELGHALGLGHVKDVTQVMHPTLTSRTRPRFGAGDLAGLRALGRMTGCP